MATWSKLLQEFNGRTDQTKWLRKRLRAELGKISAARANCNVIVYFSGWLQKPSAPAHFTAITPEDINGLMNVVHGMDYTKGLSLILHTPGGATNAAETIVAYLRSKFETIEVIIPAYAMSAGTMISLASNNIIMGRQSQLGPIDPQFMRGNVSLSARSLVDQFEVARDEILKNNAAAHVWAPMLQSIGPSLLQESLNALAYGEGMVSKWLESRMLAGQPNAQQEAQRIAHYFNDAGQHKSHGRRIDRDEAKATGVTIEELEQNQPLQDAVMTAYHLSTIAIENSDSAKTIYGSNDSMWSKNLGMITPSDAAPPAGVPKKTKP